MITPITEYHLTPHALFEMSRRGITEDMVRRALAMPGQRYPARLGRDMIQSRLDFGDKPYLVRVLVDTEQLPAAVITVYRTSKIAKYWRTE